MENQYYSEHPFTEMGFKDIEKAAEMFEALKIDSANLKTIDTVKLREIAEFVEGYEDGLATATSILRRRKNSDISPIDHLYGYIGLQNKKQTLNRQLADIDKELSLY